jgi:hypothetical protein
LTLGAYAAEAQVENPSFQSPAPAVTFTCSAQPLSVTVAIREMAP